MHQLLQNWNKEKGICLVIYKDLSSPKTKLEQKLNNKNAYFDFFFFIFFNANAYKSELSKGNISEPVP